MISHPSLTNGRRPILAAAFLVTWWAVWLVAWSGTTAPRSVVAEMTLITSDGDRLVGEWMSADDAEIVSWQARDFAAPFEFNPGKLSAIYGKRAERQQDDPRGALYCVCELVTGDLLSGTPISINAQTLEFALSASKSDTDPETISIPRKLLKRLTGFKQSDELLVSYPGDGKALLHNATGEWKMHGGKLVADSADASCFASLPELPFRSSVEIDLSWEANTDFAVSLMSKKPVADNRARRIRARQPTNNDPVDDCGLRMESWGDRIVLLTRAGEDADLLLVADDLGGSKAGSLRLQVYLDAEEQTASAYRDGAFIGKLRIPVPMAVADVVVVKSEPFGDLKSDPDVDLNEVRELQMDLDAAGYSVFGVDGMFGPRTLRAIQAFQRDELATLNERLESGLNPSEKKLLIQQIAQLKDELSREVAGDQTRRRLKPAATKSGWRHATEIVRVDSFEGQLTFEGLRISTWNGQRPHATEGNDAVVVRMADGELLSGDVVAWDPERKEISFEPTRSDDEPVPSEGIDGEEAEGEDETKKNEVSKPVEKSKPRKISMAEVVEILFSNPSLQESDEPSIGLTTVSTETGTQVSGEYAGVKEGLLSLKCSSWNQTVSLPIHAIVSTIFEGGDGATTADPVEATEEKNSGVKGTMRLTDGSIRGAFVEATATGNATCMSWRPTSARNSQPLLPTASGTVIYHDLVAEQTAKVPKTPKARPRGAVAGFLNQLAKSVGGKPAKKGTKPSAGSNGPDDLMTLELRSGDSIPFKPKRIDAEGVTFESPLSSVTFVPHAQVKAISLRTKHAPAELTAMKRERLLTVPRRYKDRPPTHLLLSVNKDVLRGRLISMDDQFVTIEMRMTPRRIPRDRISAIVWLDDVVEETAEKTYAGETGEEMGEAESPKEDWPEENPPKDDSVSPTGFHVLATKRGGQRVTILPDHCDSAVLHGKNPVLEECNLDLREVDQLAFGSDIQTVIKALETSQLALTSAAQPRFLEDDGEAGATEAGQESALVGKPAPPIKLKRLDGKKYDLAKEKGKVVVLDFWATWCGPCIQWMPRADEIVAEFEGQDVELVAVNLSETEDVITPVLKRLGMNPTVLLDIDGVVADAYKATAIPQTVVIDREGKVDRVFIGGGKQNEALLRDAIQTLVDAE